jgi:thiosulfate/3-mercaptopyruvate sulfurtransferase
MSGVLTTPEWLDNHLQDADLAVIDASWYLPADGRNPRAEYLGGHIPGAVFFDIDAIADHSTGLPHMLPTAEAFSAAMGQLGLSEDLRYVVYDSAGIFSAARVWWTLQVFGVESVTVLAGGLPRWKAQGRRLETGAVHRGPRTFVARLDASAVADLTTVARALESGEAQVVDARSAARFSGEAPEPRPGLPSGHMPGSVNLPYQALLDDGDLLSPEDMARAFKRAGVDLEKPVITSCGSGVTAAILALAAQSIGHPVAALYDGSWTQWASRPGAPVEAGPPRKPQQG